MEQALANPGAGATARTVDAGRGAAWWTESWALFMKNPGMWLVFGLIFMVGFMVLGFIPFLGGIAASLIAPAVVGGWMLSVRKQEGGTAVEVGDLFLGFKEQLNPLIVLGAFSLVASIAVFAVAFVLGGGAMLAMFAGGAARSGAGLMAGLGMGLIVFVVCLGLGFVIAMAFWLAPALIVFRNVAPLDAIKGSWSASLANVGAFLVYGVIWIVAGVIASIPFMLGWLVMVPLTMLGMYCAYQDIFERA